MICEDGMDVQEAERKDCDGLGFTVGGVSGGG